jgi:hypothetical protein
MHIARNPAPWYADIVNYLATDQMPLHWGQQDKYCSSIVLTRSLGGVYLSLTNPMSSPFVMIMHVEAILVQRKPLQKFCSVDFIGLPF